MQKAWLDKRTRGVCLSIASKGLAITGIDDRRYWNYIPTEESRWDYWNFCLIEVLEFWLELQNGQFFIIYLLDWLVKSKSIGAFSCRTSSKRFLIIFHFLFMSIKISSPWCMRIWNPATTCSCVPYELGGNLIGSSRGMRVLDYVRVLTTSGIRVFNFLM